MTLVAHSANAGQIILASASPRRRELLAALGISFRVVVGDIDERQLRDEAPASLVTRLAETKALAVASRVHAGEPADGTPDPAGEPLVLAADTEVAWQGSVLGKPADPDHARRLLLALRDRPHVVLTGLALARGPAVVWSSVVTTEVWMRAYADVEIDRYVGSGRPLDKAGAYGIQDAEFHPVERIEGCYTNVVGLPLCEVGRALRSAMPTHSVAPLGDGMRLCETLRQAAGVPGASTICSRV